MDQVRVMQPTGRPRTRPEAVAGDKAYDAQWIRQWCLDRSIESVIPARKSTGSGTGRPPTCDDEKYEDRNVVERCVGRLKECRRIATRFEKKARHFKAMLQWAFVAEYLAV
jgi:transposase